MNESYQTQTPESKLQDISEIETHSSSDSESYINDKFIALGEPASNTEGLRGSTPLPNGKFMDTGFLLSVLRNTTDHVDEVPAVVKENVFITVNRQPSDKHEFWDDCGAWAKSACPSLIYMPVNGELKHVVKRQGIYCFEKPQRTYEPISPQPESEDLLIIQRNYASLKGDRHYKRRISWAVNVPEGFTDIQTSFYIYEYTGVYPGRTVHGNTKIKDKAQPYIRTKRKLRETASAMLVTHSAKNVHDKLNQGEDILNLPRNIIQLRNLKYNDKRRQRPEKRNTYMNNLADHLLSIESDVYNGHPFIRNVTHLPTGPSVILYTDRQMQDIKRFVCKDNGTILGIDKTYNLGELFLTTMVFKNLCVLRNDTGSSPIFFGPCFLHKKSDFQTFCVFFSHIASMLGDDEISKMTIGSDDEAALRKSIKRSFHDATTVVCSRHLRQNVKDHLQRKIGMPDKDRIIIEEDLFGRNGLACSDDDLIYNHRKQQLRQKLQGVPEFLQYLDRRIYPLIQQHVNLPGRIKNIDFNWTNNNAESMNNILKIGTDHKMENLTTLIETIQTIVLSMYKDVEKSIVGLGNYRLSQPFQHHMTDIDIWSKKTTEDRRKLVDKFYRDPGKTTGKITSTDGRLTIPYSPSGGKKPCQRKRKLAERAAPRK